jgi:integrase
MNRRPKGEGALFTDSRGYWVAEVTLPSGEKKRKYSKYQKEVKDWLREQRNAIAAGNWIEKEKVTYGDFLTRYMDEVARHSLRPTTFQSYMSLITHHIIPELGKIRLTTLRPDHLQKLYSQRLESGLSKRTVQFIHSIIHKSLDAALKQGLVSRNVSDLVESPKVTKKTPLSWSAEQVKRFLLVIQDHKYEAIYTLAIATGMREGEILALHWEDIQSGILSVKRSLQVVRGVGMVIAEPKSDSSKRSINLPNYTSTALLKHQANTGKVQGLVFTTSSGKPISPRNLVRDFKALLVKHQLPDIRFHDLRHTCATLHISILKTHPRVVQSLLGHSSWNLTMDTYSHIMPSIQEDAAENMDKFLENLD